MRLKREAFFVTKFMENTKTLSPVTPTAIQSSESLKAFKEGVDSLLSKRSYFISQVLPKLQEGQDYYMIMGKKSLSKGGAEKLTSIYNLTAIFERDDNSIETLKDVKGLVAFVCNLTKIGKIVGQGRGADTLARNANDANKTIKMAQKRAYVDAVIRTTGLSDIFTQDLESMNIKKEQSSRNRDIEIIEASNENEEGGETNKSEEMNKEYFNNLFTEENRPKRESSHKEDKLITSKQKALLFSLLEQKISDFSERERRIALIDGMSRGDASEAISGILNNNY